MLQFEDDPQSSDEFARVEGYQMGRDRIVLIDLFLYGNALLYYENFMAKL
ncbi:hypothetical protein N826_36920 [Skermanella aerolata KACC 11604]|nr:hypothetical protein N826_36920 [Skermanella aerolata KACC 11604]